MIDDPIRIVPFLLGIFAIVAVFIVIHVLKMPPQRVAQEQPVPAMTYEECVRQLGQNCPMIQP